MTDYGALIRQLMMQAQPVADKFNPLAEQMNPLATTEGARGYGGGARTIPLTEFTNGKIRPTQTSVDPKGVKKYMKRIQSGERPAVEIRSNEGTYYSRGGGEYHIVDGHTRLKAYYDLGIPDIPVVIKK